MKPFVNFLKISLDPTYIDLDVLNRFVQGVVDSRLLAVSIPEPPKPIELGLGVEVARHYFDQFEHHVRHPMSKNEHSLEASMVGLSKNTVHKSNPNSVRRSRRPAGYRLGSRRC